MKQINELWSERVQAFIVEIQRYIKYIFNDHFVFVMIFGGGAAIYYYSEWIKTLNDQFPVALLMAAAVALTVAVSPVVTLLKEADIVYLLPLEEKLASYFTKGIRLSVWTQSYMVLVVLALFMPMYTKVTGNGIEQFILFLIIGFSLKVWNVHMHFFALKINDQLIQFLDICARYLLSAFILYFLIVDAPFIYSGVTIVILIIFTFAVYNQTKGLPIQWEKLINNEQKRMHSFYRVANLFTDVPHLKDEVKRRKWLDSLYTRIPFANSASYRFLFARTLIRTKEFSGLVSRLTLLTIALLLLNHNIYFSLIVSLLFLYLTGFQLLPMLKKHRFIIWPSLYPIPKGQKEIAFNQLVWKVLLIQSSLFAIIVCLTSGVQNGVIILVINLIFSFTLNHFYLPSRMKKIF